MERREWAVPSDDEGVGLGTAAAGAAVGGDSFLLASHISQNVV